MGEDVTFLCNVQKLNTQGDRFCDTLCNTRKCYCPHHTTSGTFHGGYSAMFIASRKVVRGVQRVLQNSLDGILI